MTLKREGGGGGGDGDGANGAPTLRERTASFEREQIRAALEQANGIKTRAAETLGLTYRGLVKKMRRLGL